jgi:hypothetical protein
VPGLSLRVSSEGRKSWTLRYRTEHREQRRLTLGTYPELSLKVAKERARRALANVANGSDPSREKRQRREDATFADLFSYWYQRHAEPKLAVPQDEKRRYELHLEKPLGSIVARELKRPDVTAVRDAIAKKVGGVQSNRCIALVNRVLYRGRWWRTTHAR